MATASFGPGGDPRPGASSLVRVDDEMAAIFGRASREAGRPIRARVRSLGRPAAGGRSGRRGAAAVLLGGGVVGAALGWWVLATTPQDKLHPLPTAVVSTAPVAASPPAAASPPSEMVQDVTPLPEAEPALPRAEAAGGEEFEAPSQVDVAPTVAYARPVPAPPQPQLVPAPSRPLAPLSPPRFASRAPDDDSCARYADACTYADVRDADLQLRQSFAAAIEAGADPRAIEAVRRRWSRMRAADGDRPDLLVTDFARLASRLMWLADDANGSDDARE